MMVECENGTEERSATGSLVSARGKAAAVKDAAAANSGSSYFNKEEAILAVRCALFVHGGKEPQDYQDLWLAFSLLDQLLPRALLFGKSGRHF